MSEAIHAKPPTCGFELTQAMKILGRREIGGKFLGFFCSLVGKYFVIASVKTYLEMAPSAPPVPISKIFINLQLIF